ncbi:uncharacterized protein LOC111254504 [Varroa destructor]|uniref:Uncharacterized protein n=1 Tax=Varroa destructor TaxID=109461 RepID=A0A7M7MES8_VARDE|nr:uncharacterized protein LOC111254504 [Varroa destructor]
MYFVLMRKTVDCRKRPPSPFSRCRRLLVDLNTRFGKGIKCNSSEPFDTITSRSDLAIVCPGGAAVGDAAPGKSTSQEREVRIRLLDVWMLVSLGSVFDSSGTDTRLSNKQQKQTQTGGQGQPYVCPVTNYSYLTISKHC